MLTVDEPDGGHGDGEEGPRTHVHLDQHRRQGKEQQDDQQAAQNPHRLGDAAHKESQSGHRLGPGQAGQGRREPPPRAAQWGLGEVQGERGKDGRSSLGPDGAASAGAGQGHTGVAWDRAQGRASHHWYRKELRSVKSSRGS